MKQIGYFIFSILVCGFTHLQSQTTHDVIIATFAFSPSDLSIEVGDIVRWTNQDQTVHTTTSGTGGQSPGVPDGTWDSGNLDQDSTFTFQFDNAGTFSYYCTPHPTSMTGSITATAAGIKNNSVNAKMFNLYPVYPNPFNPSATISWEQPGAENIHISIFNLQGQLSDEFSLTKSQPGSHTFDWHPGGLPTGVYLICLTGETFTVTQRAVYLK
jgi:plastocyanin